MHILYVTSFNEKLYKHSGKKMIQSFYSSNQTYQRKLQQQYRRNKSALAKESNTILATYEGLDDKEVRFLQNRLLCRTYNLDTDEWLKQWTYNNRDIIPPEYGGEGLIDDTNILHKWGTNFNIQAARWFRKIVTLRYALQYINNKISYIVMVDCDSIFNTQIPHSLIDQICSKYSVFYHFGHKRKQADTGFESGLMGFKMDEAGKRYLQLVFDTFESGRFRKYVRWDDSYIFRMIAEEHPEIPTVDVMDKIVLPPMAGGHVIQYGPFGKMFQHHKGIHKRSGILDVKIQEKLP